MASTRSKKILDLALKQDTIDSLSLSWESGEDIISNSEYFPSDESCHTESSSSEVMDPVSQIYDMSTATGDVEIENSNVKTNRARRKHQCVYCNENVGNFARHLERNHDDELQVQEILSLEKKSKKRKKLIDRLRREGDFTTTNIVPVMKYREKSTDDYIVCKFCHGYYSSKSLRRHAKKCFFNPDPSNRFKAQIEGQTIMCGHFGPRDPLKTTGLLNMLRADAISMVAKKDNIICEVGRRYIKSHKEKHLLLVAKRYMRRLARLLISVREIERKETLNMIDILLPSKFKSLIKATQSIAQYDENSRSFKSPSLALQMGTLIKNAINTACSIEIQTEKPSKESLEHLKALITLIESDWAHEVSSEAGQNLAINKFNKPTLIPVAEDIKRMEMYLMDLISKSKTRLSDNDHDSKAFRNLMDGIFCSVMIFNKRRVGELQRMTLQAFLENHDTISSSEFEKALTNSEKILYQSLKRIVIRGKRGRGVPVLFDKNTLESTLFLINVRQNFNLKDNLFIFGLPGTLNPIAGYVVMKKHAMLALGGNKERASLLTSTRLRKQLATITQILKMDKNELEQLARFMGHTEKTHAEFYRLPDDVYQTAKVSKLLLLSKNSTLFEQYKGKPLSEIEIDINAIEESEDDDDEISELTESTQLWKQNSETVGVSRIESTKENGDKNEFYSKCKNKKHKRKLVPWTSIQKSLTEQFFRNHIKRKIPPKKDEIIRLIENNAGVFKNKSWPVIKVYVCNKYKNT